MITMDKEIWKPIPRYEGIYEVSNYGQVRSLDRLVQRCNGQVVSRSGRILKQTLTPEGTIPHVCLSKDNIQKNYNVQMLVYLAFFSDADETDVVKHKDKNTLNNRVDNSYVEEIVDLPGEVWKYVSGYERYYAVSNKGRLKACRRSVTYNRDGIDYVRTHKEREIIFEPDDRGYMQSSITKDGVLKYVTMHRLVAEAFIPNPENKPQINHIDGNPSNNCVENLEWCTAKENVQDYVEKRGRKNLTNLIKAKYGKKIVCLDTMMHFNSIAEVSDFFHCNGVAYSIENRTCCKGYTFVYESMLQDPEFNAESYIQETKNRYNQWMHAGRTIERSRHERVEATKSPIKFKLNKDV